MLQEGSSSGDQKVAQNETNKQTYRWSKSIGQINTKIKWRSQNTIQTDATNSEVFLRMRLARVSVFFLIRGPQKINGEKPVIVSRHRSMNKYLFPGVKVNQ